MSLIYTQTLIHIDIDVITQIHKHLPAGIDRKDAINHAGSVLDKAMKLSTCIPESSFCRAHLSTSRRAHAQNVWVFKLISWWPSEVIGIPAGAKIIHKQSALVSAEASSVTVRSSRGYFTMPSYLFVFRDLSEEAEIRLWQTELRPRTGCQGVIERPLPSCFFACLSRHRQRPHLGSITFVCRSHWSSTPSRKIPSISLPLFQMWSLTAPTRGLVHNHCRISQDNHSGAAGKCSKSKQRKRVFMFVCGVVLRYCTCHERLFLYVAVWMHVLSFQPHHDDDRYLISDKTQEIC